MIRVNQYFISAFRKFDYEELFFFFFLILSFSLYMLTKSLSSYFSFNGTKEEQCC